MFSPTSGVCSSWVVATSELMRNLYCAMFPDNPI